jgi:ABC-type lipoprotein release transport system permease subunit
VGMAATVLASILPARRIARVPLDEALRQNL